MKVASLSAVVAAFMFTACSSTATRTTNTAEQAKPSAAPTSASADQGAAERATKSRDGKFDGVVAGTPVAGSKFSKLQIGMSMSEVQAALDRAPDRSHTYESGKRWIPFYFGNDARRMQAYYKGEGCLIFSDGNIWGGAGGDLIRIDHDASGACYRP